MPFQQPWDESVVLSPTKTFDCAAADAALGKWRWINRCSCQCSLCWVRLALWLNMWTRLIMAELDVYAPFFPDNLQNTCVCIFTYWQLLYWQLLIINTHAHISTLYLAQLKLRNHGADNSSNGWGKRRCEKLTEIDARNLHSLSTVAMSWRHRHADAGIQWM